MGQPVRVLRALLPRVSSVSDWNLGDTLDKETMFWRSLGALNKDVFLQTSKHRTISPEGWGRPIQSSTATTSTSVLPDKEFTSRAVECTVFSKGMSHSSGPNHSTSEGGLVCT